MKRKNMDNLRCIVVLDAFLGIFRDEPKKNKALNNAIIKGEVVLFNKSVFSIKNIYKGETCLKINVLSKNRFFVYIFFKN